MILLIRETGHERRVEHNLSETELNDLQVLAWIKSSDGNIQLEKMDLSSYINSVGSIEGSRGDQSTRLNSEKTQKYRDTCIRITRYQFFRFSSDSKNIFFHEDFYQYRLLKGGVNTYELHLENQEVKSNLGTIPKCNAVCQLNSERRFKFFLSLENQNMSAETVEMRS